MPSEVEFKKWNFNRENGKPLTPQQVRDLMIESFYVTQGPMFRRAKQRLKMVFTEEDIRQRAVVIVDSAFRRTNSDFNNPTKESLLKVLDVLADMAASWGTPNDIIEHNVLEISKAIELIA